MTGREHRTLREYVGLDPFAWAAFLGVHASTIYRWESSVQDVRIDPIQRKLLAAIAEVLHTAEPTDPEIATKIRTAITTGLWRGGTLHAMRDVLELILPLRIR